jgi:hypothetical protein
MPRGSWSALHPDDGRVKAFNDLLLASHGVSEVKNCLMFPVVLPDAFVITSNSETTKPPDHADFKTWNDHGSPLKTGT